MASPVVHTAENIAGWVEKAAEKFDFSHSDILAVVHDNAANVVAALRILKEKHRVALSIGIVKPFFLFFFLR